MLLLTTCWSMPEMIPETRLGALPGNFPSLYTGHDILCCGISLWSVQAIWAPAMLPPSFFCEPLHWQNHPWDEEKNQSPWLRINTTWQNPKISVCYQHHSYSDSEIQHSKGYWEEINSALAETRAGWQLQEVPSANTWIRRTGRVASRPQTHLDPVHSVSKGRGRRAEKKVLQSALGSSSTSLFRSSASFVMWFAFVSFFTRKYCF